MLQLKGSQRRERFLFSVEHWAVYVRCVKSTGWLGALWMRLGERSMWAVPPVRHSSQVSKSSSLYNINLLCSVPRMELSSDWYTGINNTSMQLSFNTVSSRSENLCLRYCYVRTFRVFENTGAWEQKYMKMIGWFLLYWVKIAREEQTMPY